MKGKIFSLLLMLLVTVGVYAQSKQVSGTVYDAQGLPFPGASVVVAGSTQGTVTDMDGNFSLNVDDAASKTLNVTCIGFKSVNFALSSQTTGINITLEEEFTALNEIVAVGYGSKARKDLTGSVGSVSGAKLAAVPVTSAAVALQGKIAGVQVTSVDGAPGADINIRVRGGTSVTQSNEPLYIVDGFQADNINDIPPSDIASIDVLKDASLTAIYGAKGGNGVVVVTTKSAQQGKVSVSANFQSTVSHLSKKLDLMDTYDYVCYQYDYAAANGNRSSNAKKFRSNFGNPKDLDIYRGAVTHDWQDEVMGETPMNYSANVTIGGGNEKFRFNVSMTQSEDKGIILGSGVRRTNMNSKFNFELAKGLTFTMNPKFSYRRDTGAGGDRVGSGGIIDVLRYRPTNGLREFAFWDPLTVDPDDEAIFEYTNPKSDIEQNTLKKHSYSFTNQFALEWKPIKGLSLRSEVSHFMNFKDENHFYGRMTNKGQENEKMPVAEITDSQTMRYTWTNVINYSLEIDYIHNLSFLVGQEIYDSQTKKSYMMNRFFPEGVDSETAINNMTLGTPYKAETSLSTPNRTASFFGQFNYNYDHKYLFSATYRADGSTKFSPGEQWGHFPSVSGAWVISKENFFDVGFIHDLKLRASVGLAGNNNISDDMWRYIYEINSTAGPGFGETVEYGEKWYGVSGGDTFSNKKIKWETTLTRNAALDISLFGGRLTVTPEFYWNTTTDLLYKSDIMTTTGFAKQMQNIGEVSNKGFELSISGDILQGEDYVLSANLTFGLNRMKIEKLNDGADMVWDQNDRWKSSYSDYCLKVGEELGLIYGFVYDGLYSVDEFTFDPNDNLVAVPNEGVVYNTVFNDSNSGIATMPGKIKFKNLDLTPDSEGRQVIDENDRTVIGNTNPKFQGGFGLSGQYKGFDFTANFNYMYGFDVNNATAYTLSSAEGNDNNFYNVLADFAPANRWKYADYQNGQNYYKNTHIDGSVDIYKAANANATLWNPADVKNKVTHSYFIEDGSFFRCQDVTLGYTLPKNLTEKWGMSRLRVYVSGSNLFIITNYSGYDPEVDVQTGLTCGMDYNRYPRSRSYGFGLNLTF